MEFTVGQELWHSGFLVEITDGVIRTEETQLTGEVRYFLEINARLENLDTDEGFFGPPLVVIADSGTYTEGSFNANNPDVPGGLTGTATFLFVVDEEFNIFGAVLLVGDGGVNRAQVPLGSNGGEATRLEPSFPTVTGEISMALIDLTFTGAELRADVPTRHSQVEAGKRALTLRFDVLSRRGGNWNLFPQDLVLILPDGTAIGADRSDLGSIAGADAGVLTTDLSIRFLLDENSAGNYTLRFTPGSWFIGDDGVEEATFDFALG